MFSSDSRSLLRFLQRGAEGDGAGGFQIVEGNHVGALGHIDALHGALAIGRLLQVLHAPAPQIALGHVGDTAEIQVVLRRDEAQVLPSASFISRRAKNGTSEYTVWGICSRTKASSTAREA